MNPNCARCGKIVYPTEKVNCLDKFWHKACFHCETCKMTLNMKNYKGYEKKPYCNAHYPKQSFTMVADTPENLRLKQQSELQSQVRYKEEFEKNKGKGFSVVADTPELQRIKKTQDQISNVSLKKGTAQNPSPGFADAVGGPGACVLTSGTGGLGAAHRKRRLCGLQGLGVFLLSGGARDFSRPPFAHFWNSTSGGMHRQENVGLASHLPRGRGPQQSFPRLWPPLLMPVTGSIP
ncbi:LIM and SH3 domain protein 1 isoform X3 [Myotis myotis]|uniref:LIM and SH3 domain protein 1 isoform X3 n=1 Tax=Myotis myotis TaxID=51298 RepID=UPI001748B337|nr:LIM and SH3 domain protein 1 isoform X3 [Myotis myotis]